MSGEVIGNIHENGDLLNDKKSLEEAARRTCDFEATAAGGEE